MGDHSVLHGIHEHLRTVIPHVADRWVRECGAHLLSRVGLEQVGWLLLHSAPLKPAVVVARLHDDRHSVVHLRRELIRFSRYDREAQQPLVRVGVFPGIPEARECKRFAVVQ